MTHDDWLSRDTRSRLTFLHHCFTDIFPVLNYNINYSFPYNFIQSTAVRLPHSSYRTHKPSISQSFSHFVTSPQITDFTPTRFSATRPLLAVPAAQPTVALSSPGHPPVSTLPERRFYSHRSPLCLAKTCTGIITAVEPAIPQGPG